MPDVVKSYLNITKMRFGGRAAQLVNLFHYLSEMRDCYHNTLIPTSTRTVKLSQKDNRLEGGKGLHL